MTFSTSHGPTTTVIGRRLELEWLRTRLALAASGTAHMVLIEGEPGIGKTRLAREFLADARTAGFDVFAGRCYEHLDLAYLALRESLFPVLATWLEGRPDLAAERAFVRSLDGELDGTPAAAADVDRAQRSRQLLALTRLLLELSRTSPTVLLVDDLQWADGATIDLLRHLLFRFEGEAAPLLLVATCRDDADARGAPDVARLRQEPRCATLRVHPLSELEAAELAREHGSRTVSDARRIAASSEGNPLLVEVLARQAADAVAGRPAPLTGAPHPMTMAIDERLADLSTGARDVVRMAAFMVPHCTRSLLAAVTGLGGDALDGALDEAVEQGVLTGDATSVVFTHPLYGHAAYRAAPPLTRHSLHGRIAAALLAGCDAGEPVPVGAIAHHLITAGSDAAPSLVVEYATRAGDEAMGLAAWAEAARCYEGALAVSEEHEDPRGAIALHRLAGLSRQYDLDMDGAVEHFDHAIELATPLHDAPQLADLHIWRTRCAIASRRPVDGVAERRPLEQLVAQLEARDPGLASEGLAELSQSYWADFQLEPAEDAARRAMALADRVGHHVGFTRATVTLSVPQWFRYDLRGSLDSLEQGLARARAAGDESTQVGPLFRIPLVLTWLGRLDEAETRALEACALADRLNYPLHEGLPLAALSQIAVARGDFDRAERHGHQALLIQRLSGYDWAAGLFLPAQVAAFTARARFDAARDALDTWAETAGPAEQGSISVVRQYVDVLEHGIAAARGGDLPRLPRQPMIGPDFWAAAMVESARRGAAEIDVRRAYELLVEAERRGGVLTAGLTLLIPRVRGVAADLLGNEDEAVATLERAIGIARGLDAHTEEVRAQLDLATIRLRQGRRDDALELVNRAVPVLERHDMQPDLARADELLGRGATRAMPMRAAARPVESDATPTTAAILFTDVVDSTRLTETLGDARYRERARRLEAVVTSAIAAYSGRVVSGINLGDGFIGLFSSTDRALSAARRCAQEAASTGLQLHLAVHRGEILVDGPRIFGGAVNLAARICGLSGPDEILVSEAVEREASVFPDAAFLDRGAHALKGFAQPQRVFALVAAAPPESR